MAVARPTSLPPERQGIAAPAELAAKRAGIIAAVASGMWRTDPAPDELTIAGVRVLRFSPPGDAQGTVLHIHGGAFRIGCPEVIAPFAAALAIRCGMTVICPAYRLAPEHPFPAGLGDAYSVWAEVAASGGDRMILSGDSAGGSLAAAITALAAADKTPPAGLALLSPWLDLTAMSTSFHTNGPSDLLFSEAAAREAANLYLQGISPLEPLASPLFGRVDGFPPTFINVGAGEVLADDARNFRDRLHAAGVPIRLDMVEGMEHVAVTRDQRLTGASHAFEALAAFVDEAVSG